ncbi:MAG: MerR family transcriptional regulator [Bryobacteraceae bacterium]|nr:MerR family transcriptional regulator [Bryobacteraceae bacterium]
MTIGEFSAQSGVPASTIRYYERIGVLPEPARMSGQRRYGDEAINRLTVVQLAQACGFDLDEIKMLVQGFTGGSPSERWRNLATRKLTELDRQMEKITLMRRLLHQVAKCECIDLAECGRTLCGTKRLHDLVLLSRPGV